MKNLFKLITIHIISIILVMWSLIAFAYTYPTWVPTWETLWWKFMFYINDILFDSDLITTDWTVNRANLVVNSNYNCWTQVLKWFNSSWNKICVNNTRTYNCWTLPANSSWNTVSSYIQTWDWSSWLPPDSTATHNTTSSTTSCVYKCNAWYYLSGTSCIAATRWHFVPSEGATTQTACGRWTYQGSTWQSSCTACAQWTYQNSTWQSSCTVAIRWYYVQSTGATSQTACGWWTYQNSTWQSSCTVATRWHFVPSAGATTQTACGRWTYQGSTWQSSCTNCTNWPANSTYTSSTALTTNSCPWSCNTWYWLNGNTCSRSQNWSCNNNIALSCTVWTYKDDNWRTACWTTREWKCEWIFGWSDSTQCSIANATCVVAPTCWWIAIWQTCWTVYGWNYSYSTICNGNWKCITSNYMKHNASKIDTTSNLSFYNSDAATAACSLLWAWWEIANPYHAGISRTYYYNNNLINNSWVANLMGWTINYNATSPSIMQVSGWDSSTYFINNTNAYYNNYYVVLKCQK